MCRLAWFAVALIASGVILAGVFFVSANQNAGDSTPDELLGITCLVQALIGVIVMTHTRRTPPDSGGNLSSGGY
jgi:protein-S-isoprenylcysteine O-methyltransferase Ste14